MAFRAFARPRSPAAARTRRRSRTPRLGARRAHARPKARARDCVPEHAGSPSPARRGAAPPERACSAPGSRRSKRGRTRARTAVVSGRRRDGTASSAGQSPPGTALLITVMMDTDPECVETMRRAASSCLAPPRRSRARTSARAKRREPSRVPPLGDAGGSRRRRTGRAPRRARAGSPGEQRRGAFSPASRREPPERVRQRRGHPLGELGGGDQLVRDSRSRSSQRVELVAVNRHEAVTSRVQKASSQGPTHEVQSVLRGRCPTSFAGNAPADPSNKATSRVGGIVRASMVM